MRIIKRIGQYRQPGRSWYQRNPGRITKIVVHHTASMLQDKSDDEILQHHYKGHVRRGWPGLSYHFFITPNGNVYQVNDFNEVTWHDAHNWDSIGVALEGYFHPPHNQQPTQAQLQSLKELLDWLCTQNPQFPADFNDVYGHRDRWATACPGDNLYPKVKEYREKLGKVDWGFETVKPDCKEKDEEIKRLKQELENYIDTHEVSGGDGQKRTLRWYVDEWWRVVKNRDSIKAEKEACQKTAKAKQKEIDTLNKNIKKAEALADKLSQKIVEINKKHAKELTTLQQKHDDELKKKDDEIKKWQAKYHEAMRDNIANYSVADVLVLLFNKLKGVRLK